MSISNVFIRRPVGTTLLTIAIALAGLAAFRMLPVSPLPEVEFPTILVQAALPGASPQTMASAVATPLERQFGRIAGLSEMTSTSYLGATMIVLQFDLNRNIDAAGRDVQAAINAALSNLPSNLPALPTYRKVNPADAPIVILGLTSGTMRPGQMYDAASSILAQKLSQIEGIGQVFIGGSALPGVRVEVNPTRLNTVGLGLEDVRTALAAANANRPKGELANGGRAWALSDTDQLLKAADYRNLILEYRDGAAVRLSDVAQVEDSVENVRTAGLIDGKPAVFAVVFRQPGANIIAAVDRVRASMPNLKASISPAIDLSVILDRSTDIRASVRDVEITLLISIVLVVLVVFAFLRNLRATLIPGIVVPVSLIGTFGAMYLFGYSLDNLSLMALTISTGFVVDDAIVVIENIARYREAGMAPREAATIGAAGIGFTVVSMSASLVAVFIPILMMGGIVGRLFREFAVTLSVAVAISMVVSLTTTPMMCAQLLKPAAEEKHGRWYRASERAFNGLLRAYDIGLTWALERQPLTLSIALAILALSVYMFYAIPKGFFPEQDTGRLMGLMEADQDTSFQAMRQRLVDVAGAILRNPNVTQAIAFTGGNDVANVAHLYIALTPRSERQLTPDLVIAQLRRAAAKVAGASVYLQPVQDLRIGGRISGAEYQYTLQSGDLGSLDRWAPRMLAKMRTLPELADVSSDQQDNGLQTSLAVDRNTAARLGISQQEIDDTLYDAYGQRQVSTMYTPLNQYHVVMEVAPEFWQNPGSLQLIHVRSNAGQEIQLGAFTRFAPGNTPLAVNHQGQFPSVTISFNVAPGVALGGAVDAIEAAARSMRMPGAVRGSFQGTAQAFQQSLKDEGALILFALLAVYIVLGILYESYIHPVTILSTLPSAGVGALLALMICRTDLSVIALIGIILLIGIVKKNAILMIDFALEAQRKGGKSPHDAIHEACLLRFRPIMMTTMAALLGGLPLALGIGEGAELRQPLGIAIVGGLLVSQMLTLFTTPVIYLYMDRLGLRWRRLWRRGLGPAPAPVPAKA
ncbi:MAG: multidrug efflux RND transporter permease subunit [Candidatus Binataceae bacterium]